MDTTTEMPAVRGRTSRRTAKVKLTEAEVKKILAEIPKGTSRAKLCRMVGMHRTTFDRTLARDHGIVIESEIVARTLGIERTVLARGAELVRDGEG